MDLFNNINTEKKDRRLHDQLIKLGDMMGDGLHHEPGGKWIEKEYKAVAKALYPEMYVDVAKRKKEARNEQMAALLRENKCECGGVLKQVRSGSKVCECLICGKKYQASKKKK